MGLTHQQLVEVLACALVAAVRSCALHARPTPVFLGRRRFTGQETKSTRTPRPLHPPKLNTQPHRTHTQGNRIYTSGATGTNAAVIKGALRAIEGDGSGGGGAAAGKGGAGGGGGSSLDAALASMGKARAADADNDPASGGAEAGAGGAATAAGETAAAADDDDDASAAAIDSSRLRPPPTTRPMAGDDDRLTVILPQSLSRQPQESRELLARVGRVVEMPRNDGLALLDASRICNREIIGSVQQVVCFAFRDSRLLLETCAEAKDAKKIVTLFYLD